MNKNQERYLGNIKILTTLFLINLLLVILVFTFRDRIDNFFGAETASKNTGEVLGDIEDAEVGQIGEIKEEVEIESGDQSMDKNDPHNLIQTHRKNFLSDRYSIMTIIGDKEYVVRLKDNGKEGLFENNKLILEGEGIGYLQNFQEKLLFSFSDGKEKEILLLDPSNGKITSFYKVAAKIKDNPFLENDPNPIISDNESVYAYDYKKGYFLKIDPNNKKVSNLVSFKNRKFSFITIGQGLLYFISYGEEGGTLMAINIDGATVKKEDLELPSYEGKEFYYSEDADGTSTISFGEKIVFNGPILRIFSFQDKIVFANEDGAFLLTDKLYELGYDGDYHLINQVYSFGNKVFFFDGFDEIYREEVQLD